MTVVKLTKPISHGDDTYTELDLRAPTIDDICDLGDPYLIVVGDGETHIRLQPKIILKYAARLSGLPPSSLKEISIQDLNNIKAAVLGFLGDTPEAEPTLPTAPLKSPGSLT